MNIDLVTTNDFHGSIVEQYAYFMNSKYPPKIIGGSGFYKYVKENIDQDKSLILDAGNYSTFTWSTGETTQQITVNTEGSYSVSVIDANGCPGESSTPFIVSNIVNTSVIFGPTNPTQFQTVTYSVIPSAGSTYNWSLFGGTIESGQGTNTIDVKWNNSGMFSFSVIETDVNGCVGEEITLLVNVIINSVVDININSRKLTKITDVLGRESKEQSNIPLFYIFLAA